MPSTSLILAEFETNSDAHIQTTYKQAIPSISIQSIFRQTKKALNIFTPPPSQPELHE